MINHERGKEGRCCDYVQQTEHIRGYLCDAYIEHVATSNEQQFILSFILKLSSVSFIIVGVVHYRRCRAWRRRSLSVLMFPISCDFLFHYIHMCYFIYLDYDVRFITGFTVGSVLLIFFSFLCCVFVVCPRSVSFAKLIRTGLFKKTEIKNNVLKITKNITCKHHCNLTFVV